MRLEEKRLSPRRNIFRNNFLTDNKNKMTMKKNYITPLIEVCETELQGMIMTSPGGTNLSGVTPGNEEEKPTEFAKEHDNFWDFDD